MANFSGQCGRHPVVTRHKLVLLSAIEALYGGPVSVEQRRKYDGLANYQKIKKRKCLLLFAFDLISNTDARG